ncbi:unnamed protein product [Linum tenue]|uniref:DUF4283 domain-containing protein n=1 Tax=Linum tenue TaxID=586396 RepID=A0AAV0HWU5_9ROSI|nr:unnamed protein product [Linum tenue]
MLGDDYITTQQWKKDFVPRKTEIVATLAWLQLPDLPIEFYHPEAVTRIASYVGKLVRLDRAMKLGARGKYARVCVEVDLSKPLLVQFKILGKEYDIQWEGLTNICFECGK